jgi:dCTP deaminase
VEAVRVILVDRTIKREIAAGRIVIDPYDPDLVGPSSYDFHLAPEFMVFNSQAQVIDPKHTDGLMEMVVVKGDKPFVLHPNQFALAGSVERFTLAPDLVGQVNGKSSLGRLGLQVHATAGFFDPGWDGVGTLELSNVAPIPLLLYPGMLVAQMVFMQGSEEAERPYGSKGLGSKYRGATTVQASRYHENYGA